VRDWYEQFLFHRVYQRLNQFCVVDLSAIYFYVLKDRLYTAPPKSLARRSAQTAIWKIGEALVRFVAPVMSFTADEIWRFLPSVPGRPDSVHVSTFPKKGEIIGEVSDQKALDTLVDDWDNLFAVRDEVLKALEAVRQTKVINDSLEAKVTITAPEDVLSLLQKYQHFLDAFFVVSATELKSGEALSVSAEHAPGEKCERCWNYSTHVGEDKNYPTVCERCSKALAEIERG
jgi:isoleucyl-tRNA synthetase